MGDGMPAWCAVGVIGACCCKHVEEDLVLDDFGSFLTDPPSWVDVRRRAGQVVHQELFASGGELPLVRA